MKKIYKINNGNKEKNNEKETELKMCKGLGTRLPGVKPALSFFI